MVVARDRRSLTAARLRVGFLKRSCCSPVQTGCDAVVASLALDVALRDPRITAMAHGARLLKRLVRCGNPRLGFIELALRSECPAQGELRRPDFLQMIDAAIE